MSRFFSSLRLVPTLLGSLGVGVGLLFGLASACSSSPLDSRVTDANAGPRLDGAVVDPTEGGYALDAGPGVTPDCQRYCELVTTNCTGDNAQYVSKEECLSFCAFLPPIQPTRDVEEKHANSVACRQYWADSPAKTDPLAYCLAAGPFGGNVCGDRCTTFCDVLLSACSPGAPNGQAAYATQPECATACASFSYRDASTDGGGETPTGPNSGDTLNCRLYHLRSATQDPTKCEDFGPDGGICD